MGYSLDAVMGLLTNSMSYQLRDAGASQGVPVGGRNYEHGDRLRSSTR
jgi:hypothetical protein